MGHVWPTSEHLFMGWKATTVGGKAWDTWSMNDAVQVALTTIQQLRQQRDSKIGPAYACCWPIAIDIDALQLAHCVRYVKERHGRTRDDPFCTARHTRIERHAREDVVRSSRPLFNHVEVARKVAMIAREEDGRPIV